MNWEEYCLSKKGDLQKMFPNKNIDNPKTLSEKIQWLKIYDSTYLKAYCADKITVREYCKQKLGIDLCIPLLKIYNKPEEIEWNILPNQFVIKCNHGSAMNIIVENKELINTNEINAKLNKWLSTKYGDLSYELYYNLIQPKIIIEPFMKNEMHKSLTDYKILCCNGEVKAIQVDNERGIKDLRFNYYTPDFIPMKDVSLNIHPADYSKIDEKPKNFELMKKYATELSKEFKLVRVDFYEIDDKLYLGELTFLPHSGRLTYKNPETDLFFGNMLKLT